MSQVTTPLTYPIRYALYLLQLALYEAYRHFRWGMAISGWVFPEPDELGNALAQQFINPSVSTFAQVMTRPLQEWPPEQERCVFFPAPPSSRSRGPAVLTAAIRRTTPTGSSSWSRRIRTSSARRRDARRPDDTRELVTSLRSIGTRSYAGSLGNAIDFYLRRANEIADAGGGAGKLLLPDWNLDGDRGYASKCWDLTEPPSMAPNDLAPPNPAPPAAKGVEITYL